MVINVLCEHLCTFECIVENVKGCCNDVLNKQVTMDLDNLHCLTHQIGIWLQEEFTGPFSMAYFKKSFFFVGRFKLSRKVAVHATFYRILYELSLSW